MLLIKVAKRALYWVTLGMAAGGLGGLLVGGIGGRLAMFVLRLTTDTSIRGIESDDGFTMGRFDLSSTVALLAVATVLGAVGGLAVVAGRPFFRSPWMPAAWAAAGGLVVGAVILHTDGVDFTILEPTWLAIVLFVAIPAAGAALIAWLCDVYPRFWWRHWPGTAAALVPIIPGLVVFPVWIAALIVGSAWHAANANPSFRELTLSRPVTGLAVGVFGLITLLGALDLIRDSRDLL